MKRNSSAILKMPKMAMSDGNAAQRNVIEYCVKLKKRPALIENTQNILFNQDNAPCYRSQDTN
jgi:hypothetical protein